MNSFLAYLVVMIFSLKDVFIFDTKQELFVWVGNHTTHEERKNALIYAHVSRLSLTS